MRLTEKLRGNINPWLVGWSLGALVFAVVVSWQNRGLTFFWDEWDVVWATVESPYFGLLQDNGGNFFPLSRAVFGLELAVFGSWYPGYVFVTSLFFGIAVLAFMLLLDNGTTLRRTLLTAFSLIYLSSTGVLFASSMGFMLKWALSPLLAIISAAFFIKAVEKPAKPVRYWVLAWMFFAFSWAAFSSSITLMGLLIIGLIHSRVGWNKASPFSVRLSIAIFLSSIIAILIGIGLAELNPPLNPLIGDAQDSLTSALAANPINVTQLALASTFAGLFSVVTAIPLQSNAFNSWLIIAFNDYLSILVGIAIAAIGLIYVFRKSLPNKQVILLFILLFGTNLFISIARSPLIHRYQTLWIFLAILVVLALITWFNSTHLFLLSHLITALVLIAAVLSAWHIGTGALTIGNIERQRDLAESRLLNDPSSCLTEAARTLSQIAPTIKADQVCSLIEIIQSRSWLAERKSIER